MDMRLKVVGAAVVGERALPLSYLIVQVRDDAGALLHFDGDGRFSSDGDRDRLVFEMGSRPSVLALPKGEALDVEVRAFGGRSDLLAYGEIRRTPDTVNADLVVELRSILGNGHLAPRLPLRAVNPGQEIEFLFHVAPEGRLDLRIPATDYELDVEIENGAALSFADSVLGVRAGSRGSGDLGIIVRASGWRLENGHPVQGTVASRLRLPFSTGLAADLDPPSIAGLVFDAGDRILSGVVSDDQGIAKVEVFDGPVRLASTNAVESTDATMADVTFPLGGTGFQAELALPSGGYSLTVVVHDRTGNLGEGAIDVDVP